MAKRRWVGLVQSVNVGGTGKLPMKQLAAACEEMGWTEVKTYLASGNVIFSADGEEAEMVAALERKLSLAIGRRIVILVRTADQLQDALERNPFRDRDPARTLILLLPKAAPADVALAAKGRKREEIAASGREVFVHYPDGVGESRLRIAAAVEGTARNLNTVRKLEEMARNLDED
jgi:uncharacterized protein (DUF1697 family)